MVLWVRPFKPNHLRPDVTFQRPHLKIIRADQRDNPVLRQVQTLQQEGNLAAAGKMYASLQS